MANNSIIKSFVSSKQDERVGGIWFLFGLSFVVNILFLTGPLFMMQVYDRYLPSGNFATLMGLLAIVLLLYAAFGLFDVFRLQIAALRGEAIAARYGALAFNKAIQAATSGKNGPEATAPEDVDVVRNYLTSSSLMALFDVPSIPFFLLAVSFLHPILGVTVVISSIVLAGLAIWNERTTRKTMEPGRQKAGIASRVLVDARADAVSISGNGMVQQSALHWQNEDQDARVHMLKGNRILASFGSTTKTLRMIIQSLVLAVGGWLVVEGQLSAGAMIAASVVFARAIAPIEQTLNSYRQLLSARSAWSRILQWRDEDVETANNFNLPLPEKTVTAVRLSISSPESSQILLQDVSFSLVQSDVLGVIGPSGAGKSTLARALVGAWSIQSGRLMMDNADLSQWNAEQRSGFVGYLGQTVHLIDASLAENIGRLQEVPDPERVINAAKIAGVHELILSMPEGYNTRVGAGGARLSGGQRQRIGLARALYTNPFFLVLDEPTAHLDPVGKQALVQVIQRRRAEGKITVITSHDTAILQNTTKLMMLEKGKMTISGPRNAVLEQMGNNAGMPEMPQKAANQNPNDGLNGKESSRAV